MADASDWQKVANALRDLHRALLECARRDYERERDDPLSPGRLLQLLSTDPYFSWLRALSELMVDIDMIREADAPLGAESTTAVRPAIERLIAPSKIAEAADSFSAHYQRYLQSDPHVAMAHAGIRQALAAWPLPEETDGAAALHERHRLAEKARHGGR